MSDLGRPLQSFTLWNTVGLLIVCALVGIPAGISYAGSGHQNALLLALAFGALAIAVMVRDPTSVRIFEGGIAIHKLSGDREIAWHRVAGLFLGKQLVTGERGLQYAVQVTFVDAPPLVVLGSFLVRTHHCRAIAEAVCARAGLVVRQLPGGELEGYRPR